MDCTSSTSFRPARSPWVRIRPAGGYGMSARGERGFCVAGFRCIPVVLLDLVSQVPEPAYDQNEGILAQSGAAHGEGA